MYIIAGIDYSKNAPGVVKAKLNSNFDIVDKIEYRGFTSVKKVNKSDSNILFYHKKNSFNNDFEKAIWMRERIFEFIEGASYCSIEGYAFGANGKVFDIAEACMCTKLKVYENNIPLRIYEPTVIKNFAGCKGNSGKVEMGEAYIKDSESSKIIPNLSHLPQFKTPSEDIVDAYYCMKLLQMELKLRYGIVELRKLSLNAIKIFNRVTKAYPENILVRPFLENKDN
jgi:hypothetical protein